MCCCLSFVLFLGQHRRWRNATQTSIVTTAHATTFQNPRHLVSTAVRLHWQQIANAFPLPPPTSARSQTFVTATNATPPLDPHRAPRTAPRPLPRLLANAATLPQTTNVRCPNIVTAVPATTCHNLLRCARPTTRWPICKSARAAPHCVRPTPTVGWAMPAKLLRNQCLPLVLPHKMTPLEYLR